MINKFVQRRIIFHPRKLSAAYKFKLDQPFEEHFLDTPDGSSINLLLIKTTSKRPRGVVLYFHGNADNLKRWSLLHTEFTKRGYDFIVYDYRSFGKSTGKVTEENCYKDASLVYQFTEARYPTKKMVLYGRSLGTAMAAHVAHSHNAKVLILETPFHNMKGIFKMHTRALPVPLPDQLAYRFPIDEYLPEVNYPILILQGTKDRLIPLAAAKQLEPLLKKGDQFITIKGGRHNNLRQYKEYADGIDKFIGAVRKSDIS